MELKRSMRSIGCLPGNMPERALIPRVLLGSPDVLRCLENVPSNSVGAPRPQSLVVA